MLPSRRNYSMTVRSCRLRPEEKLDGISRREFLVTGAGAAAWPAVNSLTALAAAGDLAGLSLAKAAAMVRSRSISPVELTEACLARIDALNPKVNAYITITRELAMQQAREMEGEQKRGKWRGPLHGVPMALKDNID